MVTQEESLAAGAKAQDLAKDPKQSRRIGCQQEPNIPEQVVQHAARGGMRG